MWSSWFRSLSDVSRTVTWLMHTTSGWRGGP
jgi:hypothetical protein